MKGIQYIIMAVNVRRQKNDSIGCPYRITATLAEITAIASSFHNEHRKIES